jgi:cytochrome b561
MARAAIGQPERYGRVAAALHWLIALLILALLGTGFAAANAEGPAKGALLRPHLPLGLAVLALTLLRLVWTLIEWRRGARPGAVPGMPAWQHQFARAAHALLYIVPFGMAASGIGLMALSGAAPAIFGGDPLPDFWRHAPRIPHGIGARLLVALLLLHVGAALYHQFLRRDGLLGRLWPFGAARRPTLRA